MSQQQQTIYTIYFTKPAEAVDITPQNLSILKTGKARAIRFSTLEAICAHLECQPADILEFRPEERKKGE